MTTSPTPPNSSKVLKPLSFPQKALQKLGLHTDMDLALHLPFRYEDETHVTLLRDCIHGKECQIEVVVTHCEVILRGKRQLLVRVQDSSDTCLLRFFHFYPSHQKTLAQGSHLWIRGMIQKGFDGYTMLHPSFKPVAGSLPNALTPVYPTSAGLVQGYLRKTIVGALSRVNLSEIFTPEQLTYFGSFSRNNLWSLKDSLSFLHHPPPHIAIQQLENHQHGAWLRLKAEELLAQQLSQLDYRRKRDEQAAPSCTTPSPTDYFRKFHQTLPFSLTHAQQRAVTEIAQDLHKSTPMYRLLQGDVGSGKTIVAAIAACLGIDKGWQCALMVPTEILAEQHLRKLVAWLEPLGICVAWLCGKQKTKEKRDMLEKIANGSAHLVVGTHAIIEKKVQFSHLGLVIIDEQHKFGVEQRLQLRKKMQNEKQEPHLLMMTATPIPRTLAMSFFADLDVSTLDELPPGRTPVITKSAHESRRFEVINRIRFQVELGRQIYWVCPLIEESEAVDLRCATATQQELITHLSGTLNGRGNAAEVGLLHSRMAPDDKRMVMEKFMNGDISVLVSTTVIEVGVDVPNASLMVIEHAERFGLSQLHQLRGRVGRGQAASACVLLYSTGEAPKLSGAALERIQAMVQTTDGFEIAQRDLHIRGPGEILGARQSGSALMRFANLSEDTEILLWAKRLAPHLLTHFPEQSKRHMDRWLSGKGEYLGA